MIGVIADDLTGAAEIGAVGLRHGLRAEISVGGRGGPASLPARSQRQKRAGKDAGAPRPANLLCIDTESRSCAPAEAGRRAAAAAAFLAGAGAHWIYKKTDSVLRGEVRAELEAILRRLDLPLALLLPANPSLGRTIRGGRYFIHGRPLNQTEFARDPAHPRHSSHVLDLLGSSKRLDICVCRPSQVLPGSGIVLGEARTPADLSAWALKVRAFAVPLPLLPAGGAEFFGALLRAAGHMPLRTSNLGFRSSSGRELFVCGSTSESARQFISSSGAHGTPVFSLPEALARGATVSPGMAEAIARSAMAAFRSHRRVILNVGLPPVRRRALAGQLAGHLAQAAERLLRRGGISHVYAEGGATAVELVRRMGWHRLIVLRELAPGVATLAVAGHPSLRLTIKPGTYCWPDNLVNELLDKPCPRRDDLKTTTSDA